jgi:integrase
MPRRTKDRNLGSREARARLKPRGVPYFRSLDRKLHLGYRRLRGKAGTWWARHYIGDQQYAVEPIGTADDQSEADGREILDFYQAQNRARAAMATRNLASASAGEDGQVITVDRALARYEENLKARGAEAANAGRVRVHLTQSLSERPIALLTAHGLETWRNGLLEKMAPATANRTCRGLIAALNLAAAGIPNQSRDAWKVGLKAIPDASKDRNVVITDAEIGRIVREAAKEGPEFALYVEVVAATGSRPSQIARLLVRDLKADCLDMPSARKGRAHKRVTRRQVPIPSSLAERLRTIAAGRTPDAPLLSRSDGTLWQTNSHRWRFRRTVERARLDPDVVTIYALRHSSITRQLTAGIPIRVIAALHDTSTVMIEKNYSCSIDRHVDQIVRPALIDFGPTTEPASVTPLPARSRRA